VQVFDQYRQLAKYVHNGRGLVGIPENYFFCFAEIDYHLVMNGLGFYVIKLMGYRNISIL
jgi:hypothetical protein